MTGCTKCKKLFYSNENAIRCGGCGIHFYCACLKIFLSLLASYQASVKLVLNFRRPYTVDMTLVKW
jgi:hypothetical protein